MDVPSKAENKTAGNPLLGWSSVLLLVLALLCVEVATRKLLPVVPTSDQAPRNIYRFSGWPEYLKYSTPSNGVGRVILISNSQAFSGETPRNRIYPALLAKRLTERKAGGKDRWEVCNWSVEGVTSMEYMLLAAQLKDRAPDVVVASVGLADFRSPNLTNDLLYSRSDIYRLIVRPSTWRALPDTFLARYFHLETALTIAARTASGTIRFRDYLWSYLDHRIPGLQTIFYAPFFNYYPWDLKDVRPWTKTTHPGWQAKDAIDFAYQEGSRILLREYIEQLTQNNAGLKMLIAQPVRDPADDEPRLRFLAHLNEEQTPAVIYLNWQNALPAGYFTDKAHLRIDGHEAYAAMLADEITRRLEP